MKQRLSLLLLFFCSYAIAQQSDDTNAIEVNLLRGNVLAHSPELYHLITGHPEGVMISFSRKTHGKEAWQSLYNYPDYGGYFIYEDFKNDILGKNYAIGGHYNFYFLNRHLMLKIAQGIAMTTHPYDKDTNSKNRAFGSKYMGNTNFMLNFKKDNIIEGFGIEAGFFFTHFSNGRFKSPNSGINTYGINLGVNYDFDKKVKNILLDTIAARTKFTQPIKFNLTLRSGFNESQVIGSGQKAFYHFGFYVDKRINKKSALQLGTDLFATTSIKEYIRYRSIAYPDDHLDPDTDYKRVGVFIGHELFINRISIETQVGYYVYRPFKLDIPIYDRLGLKYYWYKNVYSNLAVKTHGFLAEAIELGIGIRI
ncbi:acyloxyacyl hydrolase [Flavobacterium sp.]|uniref:acyloxyacyl hydrolase n=1 Tax=Flavobacterium sp. TaxID=239 RepID=UPI00286C85D1|nr:acyloxyacyl hydrolase [Flavobacterium sp.]